MCLAYQLSHPHHGVTGGFVDEVLSIPGGGATRNHRLGKEPHSISSMMLLKKIKLRLSATRSFHICRQLVDIKKFLFQYPPF